MAFENERSPGLSLRIVQNLLEQFQGEVRQSPGGPISLPRVVANNGRGRIPRFILGIDGSSVTHAVRNGYPCADSSIITLSMVIVDMAPLEQIKPGEIPPPSLFYKMEKPTTFATILPGANVTRSGVAGDTPLAFFRDKVRAELDQSLQRGHESLNETLQAIWKGPSSKGMMLCVGCEGKTAIPDPDGTCHHCGHILHVSDSLSLWKSFNEEGPCGTAHGEFRAALEVLALINVLRLASKPEHIAQMDSFAFFLDGPLGMFGNIAKLSPHVKHEIIRINKEFRKVHGRDILLLGLEKSGAFKEHLEALDHCDEKGPRKRLEPGTAVLLSSDYINRRIVLRDSTKPYGETTYYGRKLLYKSRTGQHAVVNSAILNEAGDKLDDVTDEAYPRLQDILVVFDRLGSHLYRDGFMPAIRAHAHASIPLRQGSDILKELFRDKPRAPAAAPR